MQYMCNIAIVVVEHKSHQTTSPGKRARGRDESASSSKPKKRVDRLWRERELLQFYRERKRQSEQGRRHPVSADLQN